MSTPSTFHYRFPDAGRIVTARIEPSELTPLIAHFYRAYRCDTSPAGGPAEPDLRVDRPGGVYRVRVPGGDWEAETADDAVLYFEYELTRALLVGARRYVHLHGAAVCKDGRCLWLVGPSGAGKSTLTLGLYVRGWRPLADDALLLEPASGAALPFERSVRVHESGVEALELDPAAVDGARKIGEYVWLDSRPASEGREAQQPDLIAVLDPGNGDGLERVAESEGLRRLLIARLSDAPRRDFDCLARVAAATPVYHLAFSSFSAALERLAGG